MAVTWNVISYDGEKTVGSLSDVLTTLHWTASDSDGEHIGDSYGSVNLEAADAGSFIALASVTKDDLIAWVKNILGADEVTEIETRIAAQIIESKAPTKFSGVPS
tara:strand:+ start:4657 stop:4971 length:315 start_codon:yes stop_codon:yes gene_type:complete